MLFGRTRRIMMSAVLAAGLATGGAAAEDGGVLGNIMKELLRGSQDAPAAAQTTEAAPQRRVPFGRDEMQLSFAPLGKETTPAVVNVYATQKPKAAMSPFAGDPFFEQFFGRQLPPRAQSSLGSGVIVDASGLVVTNYHVISDADELKVALADGREFQSKVLLKDESLDLAVPSSAIDRLFAVVHPTMTGAPDALSTTGGVGP